MWDINDSPLLFLLRFVKGLPLCSTIKVWIKDNSYRRYFQFLLSSIQYEFQIRSAALFEYDFLSDLIDNSIAISKSQCWCDQQRITRDNQKKRMTIHFVSRCWLYKKKTKSEKGQQQKRLFFCIHILKASSLSPQSQREEFSHKGTVWVEDWRIAG